MNVNDTVMTIVGNVVDQPRMRLTKSNVAVTNFRVASTPRRRDADGQWSDGTTLYLNVATWRALAENVKECVHKGQPVVVTGRFFAREYEVDEAKRISYEIDAIAVGHDLSRGTTEFTKSTRTPVQIVGLDADGIPAGSDESWLDEGPLDRAAVDFADADGGLTPGRELAPAS